jgi:hypothetical protein
MYKYKKIALYILTFIFILLSFVEFIKYLKVDSNIFGLIYLIIDLVIIFLLVPCAYNYKKYYSTARISKLIIIIILGIFNSYLLNFIVLKSSSVIDSSKAYIDNIYLYRCIFKGILYFLLSVFTVFEFKLDKILKTLSKN